MGRTLEERMSQPPDSEHEWFRRHLPDHLLELLVEGERRRFEEHARRCAPCARLLASALGARVDWWDGAGHPPVGVLLGWNASARNDRMQEAVRAHVAACEDCRHDLEDLFGEAVASRIALAPVPLPSPRRRPRPAIQWGGIAAAVATVVAVAAIVVVWPRLTERGQAPVPADAPATGSAPAPRGGTAPPAPAPAETPGRVAEAVALVATERGAAAGTTEVRIEPGVTRVPLTLPVLFVPDGAMLEVELHDAGGTLVMRQVLAAERALRPGGVELAAADLAGGAYVLTVRWIDPAMGETSREYPLDVRTSR